MPVAGATQKSWGFLYIFAGNPEEMLELPRLSVGNPTNVTHLNSYVYLV
jgi:hypothetical protein